MSGTGRPSSESDAPEAARQKVTGAWVGYLIFALILLYLIVLDAQFAYGREWRSFTGTTAFTLAFLLVPTGGARWLRRSWRARKPPARLRNR
jgi:protein-S-isoprenylcysteine O-methyltransferase Ste14